MKRFGMSERRVRDIIHYTIDTIYEYPKRMSAAETSIRDLRRDVTGINESLFDMHEFIDRYEWDNRPERAEDV